MFEGDIYVPAKNNGSKVTLEEIGVSKHGLLINDIRLWLALSQTETINLENIAQQEFRRIADFAFKLEIHSSKVSLRYFLEADRGRESGPQLQEKFAKYREGWIQESDLILFVTTRNALLTPAQAAARAGLGKHVFICNFEENRSVDAFLEAEWFSPFLDRTRSWSTYSPANLWRSPNFKRKRLSSKGKNTVCRSKPDSRKCV